MNPAATVEIDHPRRKPDLPRNHVTLSPTEDTHVTVTATSEDGTQASSFKIIIDRALWWYPTLVESGYLNWWCSDPKGVFMPYRYPPECRRRVLDLLAVGRSVASLSADLGVSDQTIYNWRRQDRIDRGLQPGATSEEQAELWAARRRIVELETELAVTKRAIELLGDQVVSPKDATRRSGP